MIKYFINHAVSVVMVFIVLFILGIVTYMNIPVSLLPDIDIPEIIVQIPASGASARELENTAVASLRRQLMQVNGLRNVRSETRDGIAVIYLSFEYGINTDMAFIEANEKIDAAMNYLPREIDRPRVIKANATDIPVFNLDITLKNDTENKEKFIELSEFAETVIRRRFEQLPQVAMVDISGVVKNKSYCRLTKKYLPSAELPCPTSNQP
jgi:multidrug efflux pump subunit AcrB